MFPQADGSHRDYSAQLAADVTLLWKHATTQAGDLRR